MGDPARYDLERLEELMEEPDPEYSSGSIADERGAFETGTDISQQETINPRVELIKMLVRARRGLKRVVAQYAEEQRQEGCEPVQDADKITAPSNIGHYGRAVMVANKIREMRRPAA